MFIDNRATGLEIAHVRSLTSVLNPTCTACLYLAHLLTMQGEGNFAKDTTKRVSSKLIAGGIGVGILVFLLGHL